MRLKVCQVIPTLVQGGAEKQLALLAANLDPQRFESHVIVLTHSGPIEDELKSKGVQVHLIGKSRQFDPAAFLRLTKVVRRLAPDIVHTWLFAANSYGRWAAYRAGVPIILACERCVDPWKSHWHFMVDRSLQGITKRIVTNTTAVAQFYGQHGLDTRKFTIIPNAVLPSQTPKLSRVEAFKRLGIPPRGRLIGAVGRLWKQKGYRDLVWSAELLRVAYEDVWFVVIGDGPERKYLQTMRDKYGAQEAVRFVGHRSDASEILSAFDILWNGSLYEGQSNTILEAMSRGVPVIASDIPGNRDLVVPHKTGYLYALGDTEGLVKETNHLLHDTDRMARLGACAQLRADQEFSLERMLSSYEALYTELAGMTPLVNSKLACAAKN